MKNRTLKIEAVSGEERSKIKPFIRLRGHWLEQAGFKPGHRVQVNLVKEGEMVLQFLNTATPQVSSEMG